MSEIDAVYGAGVGQGPYVDITPDTPNALHSLFADDESGAFVAYDDAGSSFVLNANYLSDGLFAYFEDSDVAGEMHGGVRGDILCAGRSDDAVFGGGGDDYLFGDAGADRLTGGAGADRFCFGRYDASPDQVDEVLDFSRRQGDKIDFDDFGVFVFIGSADYHLHLVPQVRVASFDGYSLIEADFDGDFQSDFVIRVDAKHPITARDFTNVHPVQPQPVWPHWPGDGAHPAVASLGQEHVVLA